MIAVLSIFLLTLHSKADSEYAVLKISSDAKKVDDHAIDTVDLYVWQTIDEHFSGDIVKLAEQLKFKTEVNGEFTEFHLIANLVKMGWEIKAVESTPPYFVHTSKSKFLRGGSRTFHFTKIVNK